jgi:hypothetical protein
VTPSRPLGEQDPGLLEQLAERGDVDGHREIGLEITTERDGRFGRRDRGPRGQRRLAIGSVDAPAREHVHVGRERHRGRAPGEEDLRTRRPRAEHHDRGGRDRPYRAARLDHAVVGWSAS